MNAVDTNVFVYAMDSDEPVKQAKAQDLFQRLVLTSDPTILPWQVASELLSNLRKREAAGKITTAEAQQHFGNFLAMFPLTLPTDRLFPICFDLHARFSLSHWDSMLLAACKIAGVSTLFSEDLDAGTNFDGLRVVNPFV